MAVYSRSAMSSAWRATGRLSFACSASPAISLPRRPSIEVDLAEAIRARLRAARSRARVRPCGPGPCACRSRSRAIACSVALSRWSSSVLRASWRAIVSRRLRISSLRVRSCSRTLLDALDGRHVLGGALVEGRARADEAVLGVVPALAVVGAQQFGQLRRELRVLGGALGLAAAAAQGAARSRRRRLRRARGSRASRRGGPALR